MVIGKRQQGEKTGAFNRRSELALITGIGAGNAGRNDLARLGNKITQGIDVLVINLINTFCSKTADPLPLEKGRLGRAAGPLVFVKFLVKRHVLTPVRNQ